MLPFALSLMSSVRNTEKNRVSISLTIHVDALSADKIVMDVIWLVGPGYHL